MPQTGWAEAQQRWSKVVQQQAKGHQERKGGGS